MGRQSVSACRPTGVLAENVRDRGVLLDIGKQSGRLAYARCLSPCCVEVSGVLTRSPSFMAFFNQQTLAKSASLTGTSLHTGSQVSLRLRPAPVDHGIKFKRMDLPDEPTIDAKVDHVKFVERATTIAEGNVKVHTVEHVLSALCGMGVDNALVEMDSNEPPIGDGSAYPFVELINKCGIEQQKAVRKTMEVREPLHIETKSG